jgi:hypothetical protein
MYRSRIVLPIYFMYGGQLVAHPIFDVGFVFCLSSPVRRRVAEAGQGILTNMFEHVAA